MDLNFISKIISLYGNGIMFDHYSREKLQSYREKKLEYIRSFAVQNSPYYKKAHKGLEKAPLNQLPPITKKEMMANFENFVTDESIKLKDIQKLLHNNDNTKKYLDKYKVLTTSGSTGQPGIFLYNKEEWANISGTFATTFRWAGVIINPFVKKRRVLIASTSPWHISTQLGITMADMKMPGHLIPANQPLQNIVKQLNEFQPEEIIIYASMAGILAEEQIAGRLHISPDLIFTTSEVLTEKTKDKIISVWKNVQPINKYAATETGAIGGQCKQGNMHFLDHKGYFEIVDDNYKTVKPGQFGTKILVTSFFHKTQPLIRYEISDSIKLATTPCKCGRPHTTIAEIQGRSEQIIHLKGTKIKDVQIHPVNFHHIMDMQPVQFWQLIQKNSSSLEILINKPLANYSEQKLIKQLMNSFTSLEVEMPKINVHTVKDIPKEVSGKLPFIKIEKSMKN